MQGIHCLGAQPRRIRTATLEASLTVHRPHQRTPLHSHDGRCLHVVLDGVYHEEAGRAELSAPAGSIILKPAGLSHRNRFGCDPARSLRVEFRGDAPKPERHALQSCHLPEALPLAASIERELAVDDDELTGAIVDGYAAALLGLALRRLDHATEPGDARRRLARRCEEILRARYREPIELHDVARELDAHRSTLSRAFLAEFGCAPGEYVRELRVRHVARRLLDSDDTVGAIAVDAGFFDQSHCTRLFRRALGATPAQWRRLHRSPREGH